MLGGGSGYSKITETELDALALAYNEGLPIEARKEAWEVQILFSRAAIMRGGSSLKEKNIMPPSTKRQRKQTEPFVPGTSEEILGMLSKAAKAKAARVEREKEMKAREKEKAEKTQARAKRLVKMSQSRKEILIAKETAERPKKRRGRKPKAKQSTKRPIEELESGEMPDLVDSLVSDALAYDSVKLLWAEEQEPMRTEILQLMHELKMATAASEAHRTTMKQRVTALLANEPLQPLPIESQAHLDANVATLEADYWKKSGEMLLLVKRKESELQNLHDEMQEKITQLLNSDPTMYQKFEAELIRRRANS